MKATPTLQEAIYIEGLPEWYLQTTPAAFWTRAAYDLFRAADLAGLIAFDSVYTLTWTAGPNVPKAGLAYFCKKACRQLHLNKGAQTDWGPFENMFNPGNLDLTNEAADTPPEYHPAAPLRSCLHNLEESAGQEALRERIDRFFTDYSAQENGETTKPQ